MSTRTHDIGLDANLPIHTSGDRQGALADRLLDPETIAGTGAAWVRINFVLGPWSSPDDQTRFQGRTWAETYEQIVDQYLERGLNIYGLIGHEAIKSGLGLPDFFREHRDNSPDRPRAQQWIAEYVNNFAQIVTRFHSKVKIVESFNEPDDWHGGRSHWIHPTWFADMLQQIHRRIKIEMGLSGVTLVSGPLQGLDINFNQSPINYLRQTYQYGKQHFGWARSGYPFDGVGYHLYIKEAFNPDWRAHQREIRQAYREYVDGMLRVIRTQEGASSKKQLYISEIGWPSNRDTVEDKARQAEVLKLELGLLNKDPDVALGIWFCTEDFAPGHKFYGLYQMGNPGPHGRKPAHTAFKEFCDSLSVPAPVEEPEVDLDLPTTPTNQQVINVFCRISNELGLGNWGLLGKTGDLSLSELAAARSDLYAGPAMAGLSGLTSEEKQRLQRALLDELDLEEGALAFDIGGRGLEEEEPTFFRSWVELADVPIAPATALQVDVSRPPTFQARKVGQIWNRYGWILLKLADLSGFDPGVAVAVMAIESGGQAFSGDGRMIIRFENHIFFRQWGQHHPDRFSQHFALDRTEPWVGSRHRCRPNPGTPWAEIHGAQSREWTAFNLANNLDGRAARLSISMGLAQIMGFNHATLGYASVEEMFEAFSTSERQQILGFFDFVCGPEADPRRLIALRARDFETFAALYNGPGQAARYGGKLSEAFETFQSLRTV